MQISFQRTENREDYLNDKHVVVATDFLLNLGDFRRETIELVGEAVCTTHDTPSLTRRVQRRTKTLSFENAKGLLTRYLKASDLLLHVYESGKDTGNLRGAFLERLVYELLRQKYGDNGIAYELWCKVTVEDDGETWTSARTVDAAAWDGKEGECHECKVKQGVDKDDINNLIEIHKNSSESLEVVLSTLRTAETFSQILASLGPLGPIAILGRDSLLDIVLVP